MIKESSIRKFFDAKLMAISAELGLNRIAVFDWVLSNQDLEPGAAGMVVIKPSLLVAPPIGVGLQQDRQDLRGIYQITLWTPIGTSLDRMTDLGDEICAHFNLSMYAQGIYDSIQDAEIYLVSPAQKSPVYDGTNGASITVSMNYRINSVELY